MFYRCSSFNKPLDNWDVTMVGYMDDMFYFCTKFNQPLNNWQISLVNSVQNIFEGCKNLDVNNYPKNLKEKLLEFDDSNW